MALEGSLRDFDLFSLFNMIKTQGKSGTLVLSEVPGVREDLFRPGRDRRLRLQPGAHGGPGRGPAGAPGAAVRGGAAGHDPAPAADPEAHGDPAAGIGPGDPPGPAGRPVQPGHVHHQPDLPLGGGGLPVRFDRAPGPGPGELPADPRGHGAHGSGPDHGRVARGPAPAARHQGAPDQDRGRQDAPARPRPGPFGGARRRRPGACRRIRPHPRAGKDPHLLQRALQHPERAPGQPLR